jgi:hypothetical protein
LSAVALAKAEALAKAGLPAEALCVGGFLYQFKAYAKKCNKINKIAEMQELGNVSLF